MRIPVALACVVLAGCLVGRPAEPTPYYQDVIAGAPFTELVVEIDHAPGRAPSRLARDHLLEELRNVTSKTGVSIKLEQSLPDDENKRWTSEDLLELERETRTTQHAAPVALLHVLYPAGTYSTDGVAGITISGTQLGPITVFLDTIDEIDLGFGPIQQPPQARDEIERSTLLHEAGHAMGLVDNGLPMVEPHEDAEHEGHSSNPQSVMYWQVDQADGIREFLLHDGSIPVFFDNADRADLRSVGGR